MFNYKRISLIIMTLAIFALTACGELPDVAGKDLDSVKNELASMKKDYTVSESTEFSEQIERGFVTRIEPASGTKAEKGTDITIYVSKGAPITVSDFYKSNAETAKTALASQGLSFSMQEQYSEDVAKGDVIESNPVAGTQVETGTVIELIVSLGSEYRKVPDYTQMSYEEFKDEAEELGLSVNYTYDFSDEVEQDYIIDCSSEPNSKASVNQKIDVVVSKGAGIEMPDVVGKSRTDAINTLEQKGLNYYITDSYSSEKAGNIISANHGEGERVAEGDTIELVASKGTVEQEFKSQCEAVSYDDLIRNPSKYTSTKIKIKAHVKKVENNTLLGFKYGETIWATLNGQEIVLDDGREVPEPALREGDDVTIYGYGNGTSTINVKEKEYQGSIVLGFNYNKTVDSYDVPNIKIEYIDF